MKNIMINTSKKKKKMESVFKILESFCSVIYPLRLCLYFDQDCIFNGSDIINQQLRIKIGIYQRKTIIT